MSVLVEVSFGELIDKITILRLKSEKLAGQALVNVERELGQLEKHWSDATRERREPTAIVEALQAVNRRLWDIEDAIRIKEAARTFDDEFIELARSVYITNDERARLKREINTTLGSDLIEEKHYVEYGRD